ncbi:hypothetical protein DPMN_007232 [Dreissena polymorpha]|uniref:Uncharacterized protein n=1 Tax=Dreissena polymorpha TaxID=45954 RepID=A0A9D4RYJ4_DREPO|nr:hypothetical protein DPMN_007232 [Dreissena polymorpha]
MNYSQQHTTDLTGGGFLYRCPSFFPNGKTGSRIEDDVEEKTEYNIILHFYAL